MDVLALTGKTEAPSRHPPAYAGSYPLTTRSCGVIENKSRLSLGGVFVIFAPNVVKLFRLHYVNFFEGAALAVLPLHFLGRALGVQIMICGRGAPLRSLWAGARSCLYGY